MKKFLVLVLLLFSFFVVGCSELNSSYCHKFNYEFHTFANYDPGDKSFFCFNVTNGSVVHSRIFLDKEDAKNQVLRNNVCGGVCCE